MRRFAFLAVVLGSQLATGCYCYRPYYGTAFPRLQNFASCASGGCAVPFGGGAAPAFRPLLNGPLATLPAAPISAGFPVSGDYGAPLSTMPSYPGHAIGGDPGYAPIGGGAGCAGCGASMGSVGHAPVASGPVGYPPGAFSSGGYPSGVYPGGSGVYPGSSGVPAAPGPMPMVMPSALPGGVPHDSALLKMPTIVPPTTSKRPEELARQAGK